ncbi:hypothetical protein J6590_008013 [Homalodisca vitripennis]|nr:hypothetical protein J6590_008013 [Homalodisca vitripennis]
MSSRVTVHTENYIRRTVDTVHDLRNQSSDNKTNRRICGAYNDSLKGGGEQGELVISQVTIKPIGEYVVQTMIHSRVGENKGLSFTQRESTTDWLAVVCEELVISQVTIKPIGEYVEQTMIHSRVGESKGLSFTQRESTTDWLAVVCEELAINCLWPA